MNKAPIMLSARLCHASLLAGSLLLLINHLSVIMGHPWLIPPFLRPY